MIKAAAESRYGRLKKIHARARRLFLDFQKNLCVFEENADKNEWPALDCHRRVMFFWFNREKYGGCPFRDIQHAEAKLIEYLYSVRKELGRGHI